MIRDLVAFVTARIDEDEAAARDAFYEGQRWITEEEGVYRYPVFSDPVNPAYAEDELVQMADRKRDARHIARHDPARVLRDVAAKRKILAEHERGEKPPPGCAWFPCVRCKDESGWPATWPCPTLRALAAVWSDHPGYVQVWA